MANKIRHLLHRRSLKSSPFTVNIERETLNVENPKAPLYNNIEYGELAVNYGKGHEGVFLRNSEDEVIQLNTMKHIRYDGAVDKSFEKYLDDRFVNRSGDTMYGDFTITKDWETDDPKFKYIGSSFAVSGVSTVISGDTLDITENTVTSDIETGKTDIKDHTYVGKLLDADIETADVSGNTLHITEATSMKIDTTLYDLSGTTTNMQGTSLNENYTNINRTATTEVNNITNQTNNVTNQTNKYETVKTTANTVTNNVTTQTDNFTTWNLSATTNNFNGTDWDIKYTNVNLTATTENNTINEQNNTIVTQNNEFTTVNTTATTVNENINDWNVTATTNSFEGDTWDINYDVLNITGTTTTMQGDTLNEYYKNITRTATTINTTATTINNKATTINNTATTENNYVDTTNFYGDVNVTENFNVSGDSIFEGDVNISGDTIIDKTLTVNDIAYFNKGIVIPSGYEFEGQLKEDLTFESEEKGIIIYNNTAAKTIKYVHNDGDSMSGKLTISSGGLSVVGASTFDGNMAVTGTITASSAIYSSDKDLKKDIKNINKYDIETVADVELKSYKFIDDETKRERYGVIAQDLESVGLEHLVVKGENGKKGVDYISFLILKIAQLEKEIEELKKNK